MSTISIVAIGPDDSEEKAQWERALSQVIEDNAYCLGRHVEGFESQVQEFLGIAHAIGASSGTDALRLGLQAAGVETGDEVLVPAFSFFATASVVEHLGARPIFVDVDRETLTIDVAAASAAVSVRTRAMIPVHLYGQAAAMKPLLELAHKHDIAVVEDAAQAFGVRYEDKPLGALGSCGMFSFYPTKNLGAPGDAGMLVCSDAAVAERARSLRVHGDGGGYQHKIMGWNARMDGFCAAILSIRLRRLPKIHKQREANAQFYLEQLQTLGLTERLRPLGRTPGSEHCWHQFVLLVDERDSLKDHLKQRGIASGVYYPTTLPQLEAFAHLGHRPGEFPVAEAAAREVLALPVHHRLTDADRQRVVDALREF